MLYSIPNIINENVILGGDLNFFFNTSLETQGGNPVLKKHLTKRTFHQNGISGRIQRRLNYFLISNFLQETIIRADVLVSFCSDHSPITFTIAFELNNKRGKGLWKFNKSFLSNDEYTNKLKNHISESLTILDQNGIREDQIK